MNKVYNMNEIYNIIQDLSSLEKVVMFNALQRELNRVPEYTIAHDKNGYYIKCDIHNLSSFRFEEKRYAELAYHIYDNIRDTGIPLTEIIRYTFRLLNIDSEWTK